MNCVQLVGRVGQDPKTFTSNDDGKVFKTTFSLATTSSYKSKKTNEWVEQTQWHNVATFSDVSKRVGKGDMISVEGRIEYRSYENREGQTVYITEVIARSIKRLVNMNKTTSAEDTTDSPRMRKAAARTGKTAPKQEEELPEEEGDLPF